MLSLEKTSSVRDPSCGFCCQILRMIGECRDLRRHVEQRVVDEEAEAFLVSKHTYLCFDMPHKTTLKTGARERDALMTQVSVDTIRDIDLRLDYM